MSPSLYTALPDYHEYPAEEMRARARNNYMEMNRRRTVREFSDRPVPGDIIEDCIRTAATAPSGANQQPWTFVVVSDPAKEAVLPDIKRKELADVASFI